MGLSDQYLFLFLAEPLCQPHHLVGIIQSRVWLSIFLSWIDLFFSSASQAHFGALNL